MRKLFFILVALFAPVILSACQTAQVGTSSYAGSQLGNKAISSSKRAKPAVVVNERFSSVIKPEKRVSALKLRKSTKKKTRLKRKKVRKTVKRTSVKRKSAKRSKKRSKTKHASRRGRYRSVIAKHARANGVPLSLAMAVVQVESNYRANARGAAGEIGLMQLMPRTARHIGYKGPLRKLYNPNTNIRYGMKYLGKAYRLGGRSTCGAILKYNAGHGAKRMNPISRKYCKRVRRILRRG